MITKTVKIVPVPEVEEEIAVAEVAEETAVATVVAEVNAVIAAAEADVLMTRPVADAEPVTAKIAAEVVVAPPEATAHPALRVKKARAVAVVAALIPVVVKKVAREAMAAEVVVVLTAAADRKEARGIMVAQPMAEVMQVLPRKLNAETELATKESLAKNGIPTTDNLELVAANAILESPKASLATKRKTMPIRLPSKVLRRPRRAKSPRWLRLSLRNRSAIAKRWYRKMRRPFLVLISLTGKPKRLSQRPGRLPTEESMWNSPMPTPSRTKSPR